MDPHSLLDCVGCVDCKSHQAEEKRSYAGSEGHYAGQRVGRMSAARSLYRCLLKRWMLHGYSRSRCLMAYAMTLLVGLVDTKSGRSRSQSHRLAHLQ